MMPIGYTATFFQKTIPAQCKKDPPNRQVSYHFCQRITSAAGRNTIKPVILVTLFHIIVRSLWTAWHNFGTKGLTDMIKEDSTIYCVEAKKSNNFGAKESPAQCKKVPPKWQVLYRFCQRITSAAGRNDIKPVILVTLFHIVVRSLWRCMYVFIILIIIKGTLTSPNNVKKCHQNDRFYIVCASGGCNPLAQTI